MYENDKQEMENDILVLYILGQFDIYITEKALTEVVLSPGLVNYFSFCESLKKLREMHYIDVFTDNDGTELYGTTEDGRVALNSLVLSLSPALKNTYDDVLLREKDKITSETMLSAYHFVDVNHNNAVRCYIRENGNKIVDIRLPVPDKETALEICEKWKTDAYDMLMKITEIMLGMDE